MEINRWKLIAGGAALVGVVAGGVALADDGPPNLNDRRPGVTLSESALLNAAPPSAATDDGSPESADSPNESVEESTDSPFDSPGDPDWVDASPESADSPNESAEDSPPPAPAPSSAGDFHDSPASAGSPVSMDSPESRDSD